MIIVLKKDISDKDKAALEQLLSDNGYKVRQIDGEEETVLGAVGINTMDVDAIKVRPGVASVIPISKPYKMASRQFHPQDSIFNIGPVKIGGPRIVLIAGPCAVESEQQILDIAKAVKQAGAVLLRGGAYKPRTSPYSFQGLGAEGLQYLHAAGLAAGLPTVSEIVSPNDVDIMARHIDMFQIGARNMQNFELLKAVGAARMPVLLKRGLAATIEEWLMAAEYLLSAGTDKVILCERGIRTFGRETRNTLDISAIPVVRELTHLPVIVDPSHATGLRNMVPSMALAAVAAGAHGLSIEVHNNPDMALSDGAQTLWPQQFEKLVRDVEALCPTMGRELARLPERHQQNILNQHTTGEVPRVAFQGVRGANSERAITQYFSQMDVRPTPFPHFEDIFKAVQTGQTAWSMVPIENSLAGSVLSNYDLLSRYPDVKIVGETKIRVQYCLLALSNAEKSSIKQVYSHPQALAQCEENLNRNGWKAVPYFDTAGAAAMIKEKNDTSIAAIASREAADFYNLKILGEGMETNPNNYTRFVIIAHTDNPEPENANKVSFTFSVKNTPGALADCLQFLKNNNINMSKLESRPIEGKPWSYMFYVDAILPGTPVDFIRTEEKFRAIAEDYRRLGVYRAG